MPAKRAPEGPATRESDAQQALGAAPVYTRGGDAGQTSLFDGRRVHKHDGRVEAYGTVDELNAAVSIARELCRQASAEHPKLAELAAQLVGVQRRLFALGALLADPSATERPAELLIRFADVAALEKDMDQRSAELRPLGAFVLPGGCLLNAQLHLARTVCRRVERRCVAVAQDGSVEPAVLAYLNRLSDALFVWSRWASAELGAPEIPCGPGRSGS